MTSESLLPSLIQSPLQEETILPNRKTFSPPNGLPRHADFLGGGRGPRPENQEEGFLVQQTVRSFDADKAVVHFVRSAVVPHKNARSLMQDLSDAEHSVGLASDPQIMASPNTTMKTVVSDERDNDETVSPIEVGSAEELSCRGILCLPSWKPASYVAVFLLVFIALCYQCRMYCKRKRDERGEYRQVAEHYEEMLFADNFDDEYSVGADDNQYDDDDDLEDNWGSGPAFKKTIELGQVSGNNEGLSLEEVNG